VTLGIKTLTPNAAFLDQMWLAGLALFAILAALSLRWPEVRESKARDEPTPVSQEMIPERDLLFDVLSIGAVVATVALVLFFF
jgi:hypothetical protein